jgi:hypothetical protein
MLMVTTETIAGHSVERVLGLVEAASSYVGGRPSGFSGCVLYGTAVVISPEPTDHL